MEKNKNKKWNEWMCEDIEQIQDKGDHIREYVYDALK